MPCPHLKILLAKMLSVVAAVTLVLVGSVAAADTRAADLMGLKPFTSDGCSAWPDGTLTQATLWLSCCETHDVAYWQGGTYVQRKAADEALRKCVADIGEPEIGAIMLAGVRVGGSPWWPTSFRWGYGWPWPRGYGALTEPEKRAVQVLR